IHLFLQLRPGQTRGVPPLSPVMLTLKLVDEFTIATLMQARIAASAGGFFETDPTAYTPQENAPDGTPGRALELDLEPGVTRQLPPGLKFAPFDPA
ncbi:phage portal protein, partial [Mangrovimonas sp. AS39]|uniref:phage portal protein n=1 Tax=Mangrovimonas futianensis TaxID=2895523 RepID=UPI001E3E8772